MLRTRSAAARRNSLFGALGHLGHAARPFNPYVAPSGAIPLTSWDADHVTQAGGTVSAIQNQGSIGAANDALLYSPATTTYTAANAAFGNKPTIGLQANTARIGAARAGVALGARSWIFVCSSDQGLNAGSPPGFFIDANNQNQLISYGKYTAGKIALTGARAVAQLETPVVPNATPMVLIVTLAADGSAKIFVSALTPKATAGAGGVTVVDMGGAGAGFTISQAFLSLASIAGDLRAFQFFGVDLAASGDVPYYLNGWGKQCAIPIGA